MSIDQITIVLVATATAIVCKILWHVGARRRAGRGRRPVAPRVPSSRSHHAQANLYAGSQLWRATPNGDTPMTIDPQASDRLAPRSMATCPFTMPAALAAADAVINEGREVEWTRDPRGPMQAASWEQWITSFRRLSRRAARMPEICSHATPDLHTHVAWLRRRGWDAEIMPSTTSSTLSDLYLAATIDLIATWQHAGEPRQEHDVHRFLLRQGVMASLVVPWQQPVVEVATQERMISFLFHQVDQAPVNLGDLVKHARDIAACYAVERVLLDAPMIDLTMRDDARHVVGLQSRRCTVTQAAEQIRLQIDQAGNLANADTKVAIAHDDPPSGAYRRTVRIDRPFVVVVRRNDLPYHDPDNIVLCAYCDRDVWRRPTTRHA